MWQPLTGRLPKALVEKHTQIAVRYNSGNTAIKTDSKDVLYRYNMSEQIKEYKLLP